MIIIFVVLNVDWGRQIGMERREDAFQSFSLTSSNRSERWFVIGSHYSIWQLQPILFFKSLILWLQLTVLSCRFCFCFCWKTLNIVARPNLFINHINQFFFFLNSVGETLNIFHIYNLIVKHTYGETKVSFSMLFYNLIVGKIEPCRFMKLLGDYLGRNYTVSPLIWWLNGLISWLFIYYISSIFLFTIFSFLYSYT